MVGGTGARPEFLADPQDGRRGEEGGRESAASGGKSCRLRSSYLFSSWIL